MLGATLHILVQLCDLTSGKVSISIYVFQAWFPRLTKGQR